jgi:hypothetical protein
MTDTGNKTPKITELRDPERQPGRFMLGCGIGSPRDDHSGGLT